MACTLMITPIANPRLIEKIRDLRSDGKLHVILLLGLSFVILLKATSLADPELQKRGRANFCRIQLMFLQIIIFWPNDLFKHFPKKFLHFPFFARLNGPSNVGLYGP